jgi:hypothetical protein
MGVGEVTAPWTELDLPRPPSVNRFMRKLGNKTPCVRAWVGEADYQLWAARKVRQVEPVKGPFEVQFIFRRPTKTRMGDLDNGIKPLMDWLQRVELIGLRLQKRGNSLIFIAAVEGTPQDVIHGHFMGIKRRFEAIGIPVRREYEK